MIIAAAQRAEHYEMAAYGTAAAWAEGLGLSEVAELLRDTLDEEKAADEKLTALAEAGINDAASAGAEDEEQDEDDDEDEEDEDEEEEDAEEEGESKAIARPASLISLSFASGRRFRSPAGAASGGPSAGGVCHARCITSLSTERLSRRTRPHRAHRARRVGAGR